jgi:hypothetical protein
MRMKSTDLKKLIGKTIYAINKKGERISGKLVRTSGQKLYIQPVSVNNKKVKTSAIIPLVLFDLLAVGTSPYGYGTGFGYGYGNPYGYGYPAGYVGGYPGGAYGAYPGYYQW